MIAFRRPYITNPDLPERFKKNGLSIRQKICPYGIPQALKGIYIMIPFNNYIHCNRLCGPNCSL